MSDKPQIVIGADHGGFEAAQELHSRFQAGGFSVTQCGAFEHDPSDDYPQYAFAVAEKVADLEAKGIPAYGIIVCRSGAGVAIAANKVKGIRAVVAVNPDQVKHARQDNNATVLALSADWQTSDEMWHLIETFISTPFSDDERHHRRVQQIAQYESSR